MYDKIRFLTKIATISVQENHRVNFEFKLYKEKKGSIHSFKVVYNLQFTTILPSYPQILR